MTAAEHPTSQDPGSWRLFRGEGPPRQVTMPPAPPWRRFGERDTAGSGGTTAPGDPRPYLIGPTQRDIVNAALHLRRPLLVTGHPGTGKSSLAHAVAHELALGPVLRWPVNSRSTLAEALYHYDAVGRLRETNLRQHADDTAPGIGYFIRLGPLGTALVTAGRPRVLLVDELDKGDVDLPNDLLTVFEEGEFEIPELSRLPPGEDDVEVHSARGGDTVTVHRGVVRCQEFPVVVITSNGEREFPPAFLRRCLRLDLPDPDEQRLRAIVAAHLGAEALPRVDDLVRAFLARRAPGELATDQLLNAAFLRLGGVDLDADGLLEAVLHRLGGCSVAVPDRLLSLLRDVGFDVTAEELVDCLWLAERIPADAPLAVAAGLLGTDTDALGAAQEPGAPSVTAWPEAKRGAGRPEATDAEQPRAELHSAAAVPEETPRAGGSDDTGPDDGVAQDRDPDDGSGIPDPGTPAENRQPEENRNPALPVRIPHPHALALPLRTARALRPLKQYRPHPSAEELDEAETASQIAHSGLLDVVTRPARDRWLDLAVVVDDGVSMLLWQQLCSELNSLLAHLGAFRQIRTYGLRLRPGRVPRLSSRPFVPDTPTVSAEVLTDPSGRTMTLVISDGAGPGWRTGAMRDVLSRWAAHGPTAVIHTLPPRMWRGSGLPTRRWAVQAPGPGAANATWRVRDTVLSEVLSPLAMTPVPVLTPSPQAFAEWARVTASGGSGGVLALWDAEAAERQRPPGAATSSRRKRPAPRVRPDAQVQRFRRAVSPEAYRLAAHLAAVSPLTIPVMRLVVRSLPRPVTTAHLAEVFLSGMLRPAEAEHGPAAATVLPQQRVFAFTSRSRDILLDAVPTTEVLASTRRVSEHIAELVGRSPDFPAWLNRPDGTSRLPDDSSAFAWLSPALQDRLGLTGLSAQEWAEQPTLPQEIRLSPPGSIYPQFPMVGYSQTSTTWSALDGGSLETIGGYRLTWQAKQPGGPSLYAGAKGEDTAVIRAGSTRGTSVLRREALALARFDHPCLPSLLDADFAATNPWAAATGALTRLGQGAPTLRALAQGLRVYESFGTDLILVLGQRLASALDHSHHAGVVHGHLTADRVLLTLDGPLLVGWHHSRISGPGVGPEPGRTGADVRALAALLALLGARTDWHPMSGRRFAPLLSGDGDAQAAGHELADEISDPSLAAVLRPFLTLPTHDVAMSAESMLAAFRDRVPRDAFLQPFSWWLPRSTTALVDHARLDLSSKAAPDPRLLLPAPLPPGAEVPAVPGWELLREGEGEDAHEPGRRGRQLTKWFRLPGRPERVSRRNLRRLRKAGEETVIRPFDSRTDRQGRIALVFGAGTGCGRSTVSVQLASALADATPASGRPPVLMLPFHPAAHVLGYRMVADEGAAYRHGGSGYRVSATISPDDVRLSPTGVWVTLKDSSRADFVHQHAPAGQPPPPPREHRDILARMRRMGTLVVDFTGGFAPPGPSLRGTFGDVDRLVVACSGDPGEVTGTLAELSWLAQHGHAPLVSGALLVLSDVAGTPEALSGHDEAESRLGPLVRTVVRVPYDQALGDDGLVDFSALDPLTRGAFRTAAHALFD